MRARSAAASAAASTAASAASRAARSARSAPAVSVRPPARCAASSRSRTRLQAAACAGHAASKCSREPKNSARQPPQRFHLPASTAPQKRHAFGPTGAGISPSLSLARASLSIPCVDAFEKERLVGA